MNYCILFSVSITLFFTCFSCDKLVLTTTNNLSDKEISDLFLLDKTLNKNNQLLKQTSTSVIEDMKETAKTKTHFLSLVDKALHVQELAKDFLTYTDELRALLIEDSGGTYTEEDALKLDLVELTGTPKGLADKNAPYRLLVSGNYGDAGMKDPQGPILDQKIQDLKIAYIDFVSELWNNGGIKGTIFVDPNKKEYALRELELELTLTSSENYYPEEHNNKSWSQYTFENKPVALIYSMLSKYQNNAKTSALAVVHFLANQMGKVYLNYDKFYVLAQPSKATIPLGETFNSQIFLGAYSSQVSFSVSVNGSKLKMDDGRASYTVKPTKVGQQRYTAKISVVNPLTGETETFTKDFYYEVIKE